MSRKQRTSLVLWIARKQVELQSGLGLQSFTKSMRRQISSGRCSAVFRSIHKSSRKRSFQRHLDCENRLTNDAAVPLTLVASVFDRSRNRWVGKLRAGAIQPFPVRFTKAKHARLEQEKIFPMIFWLRKLIDKINDAAVSLTLQSGLSLRSTVKSMRRQTSSKRCSAASRSIHKSKTCSFNTGKDLSSDIFGLKVD